MHSNRKSSKDSIKLADIRVGSDKGSLRLQFRTPISQQFDRQRQAYKGLERSDTPSEQQWAIEPHTTRKTPNLGFITTIFSNRAQRR